MISVMDMEEVLVHRMQSSRTISPSSLKVERFRSRISGAASITISQSFTPDSSTVVLILAMVASTASWVVLPAATRFSRPARILARALSQNSCLMSRRTTL